MIYIKISCRIFIFLILLLITESDSGEIITVIKCGGYTAKFCLNYNSQSLSATIVDRQKPFFNCSNTGRSCDKGQWYQCYLPCKFNTKGLKFNKRRITVKAEEFQFQLGKASPSTYELGSNLTIIATRDVWNLIPIEEISIEFSEAFSIVPKNLCSKIIKENNSLICTLPNKTNGINQMKNINLTISYGGKCRNYFLGQISLKINKNTNMKFYFIGIVMPFILFLLILIFYLWNKKHQTKAMNMEHKKQLLKMKSKLTNTQNKAFIEYQNAVESFGNIGRLTPQYVLSFKDYTSRIFNLDLKQMEREALIDNKDDNKTEFLQNILLDQNNLIPWIAKIESNCRAQDRSTVSSLLTIVLFQHPDYFLKILKILLQISASKLKIKSEEVLFFRKSDSIVEKLVGNWISLCMYQNLKSNEIGRKFFNMYRAIKCKIESGLMDLYTNKVEYALTFDHVMVADLDYEKLEMKVSVSIYINHMDSSNKPLHISMENHHVEVLSLDSISQVKYKILDSIIMSYVCQEVLKEDQVNCTLALTKENEFNLFFVSEKTNMLLQDLDSTSLVNKNFSIVNTMKHYNMKSGMNFLFLPTMNRVSDNFVFKSESKVPSMPVHLQLPSDSNFSDNDKINLKELERKLPGQPFIDDCFKDNYLIYLLGVKKSLSPFIDGFFQYLMNWQPEDLFKTSSNSLFKSSDIQSSCITTETCYNMMHGDFVSKELYLYPIFYLFSMFDNVAQSLSINNANALKLWKSNSFILRFWINLIKNPSFIFHVDSSAAINDSLTTIATALMDSCSIGSSKIDTNTPVVKQLFLEDIKQKYSRWWDIFVNSTFTVNEEEIITIMTNIIKVNGMEKYYNSSVERLEVMANNWSQQEFSRDWNQPKKC